MPISMREKIYSKIRKDIIFGKLYPGERLVENKLAEESKSSRGPIREALLQLAGEGFLTVQPNKGIVVSKLSLQELDEIFSLRCLLESYAVRLATEQATPKKSVRLKSIHSDLIASHKKHSLTNWAKSNIAFHAHFIQHSENSNLMRLLDGLRCRTYRYTITTISIPGAMDTFIDDHEKILTAYIKRDAEAAQKGMHSHMENVKRLLLGHLQEYPGMIL